MLFHRRLAGMKPGIWLVPSGSVSLWPQPASFGMSNLQIQGAEEF